MSAETAPPGEAPTTPKFSRYRSVRRAQHAQSQEQTTPAVPAMPPVPAMEPHKDAPVSRSMSRYHRRPNTSHAPNAKGLPVRSNTVEVPPIPSNPQTTTSSARTRALSSPHNAQPRLPNASRSRADAAPLAANHMPSQTARDEAKELLSRETERHKRMQEKLKAEKRAKVEAEQAERERQESLRREEEEAARLKAQREQEEADQLRRQKEEQERGKKLQKAEAARRLQQREEEERKAKFEEMARQASSSPPVSPPRHGGGFGFFRRRKDDAPGSPEHPANMTRSRQTSNSNSNRDLDTIRPGGGGAVLGIDAPISAVNAGDRRVMVVCNKKQLVLPVTPTTTPLDLIKSASNCLTEPIDVKYAVLLESFQKVGLKRPLRNYEHIRDVLNSWDDDKQNDLIIVDSTANNINQETLLASYVPDSKPDGMGCYIHYSSRPGKWSKRYIALRADGQLVVAKSETSKEQENICHLKDFDIYSPTDRKITKVKPPKKICYAVKSQEKSNIYVDETRYVHFFCTNDKSTAALFYRSVQGWRSWHLKYVMGEGQKKRKVSEPQPTNTFSSHRHVSGSSEHGPGASSHVRGASVGSHYQLGSFMPLLDLDQFGKDSKEDVHKQSSFPDDAPLAKLDSRAMHARKMSTRVKGPPPVAYNLASLANDNPSQSSTRENSLTQAPLLQPDPDTFAPSGLLGRTYSQRQKAAQEREDKKSTGPFTEGPSLLNNMNYMSQASTNDSGLNRRSSVRSNHRRTSSDIQRSASTRHMPKPLVDLTPQYKEPPQHARKGKGYHPDAGAGPLIENATSIEEAIKIPSSTEWRARPTTARPHGTYGTGGHERTRSLKGRGEGLAAYTVNNHSGAPNDDSNAFTGGGLLARAGFSQGHKPVGHGVMDGSKARGPMLDMRESSQFAQGSLLAGVERMHGSNGPVIERNKRQSVDLG